MAVQICLLVTDDPDDHQSFSEAICDISANAVVLIILDCQKALDLLKAKKQVADYIFLDLSKHGIRINTFLKEIKQDSDLSDLPIVVYGADGSLNKIEKGRYLIFFNKEYEYSILKKFLKGIIKNEGGI